MTRKNESVNFIRKVPIGSRFHTIQIQNMSMTLPMVFFFQLFQRSTTITLSAYGKCNQNVLIMQLIMVNSNDLIFSAFAFDRLRSLSRRLQIC